MTNVRTRVLLNVAPDSRIQALIASFNELQTD